MNAIRPRIADPRPAPQDKSDKGNIVFPKTALDGVLEQGEAK